MDLPGQLLSALGSAYRVERELGRGGMATVYLAHDLTHDRPIQVLPREAQARLMTEPTGTRGAR